MEHSLTASAYTNNLTTSFSTTRPTNQSTSMSTLQPLTNRSTTLANSTLSATSGLKTTMTSPLMNVSIYATKNQPSVVSSVHTPTKGNPAEQSRAEQSRAEQSRAESSRVGRRSLRLVSSQWNFARGRILLREDMFGNIQSSGQRLSGFSTFQYGAHSSQE